MTQRFFPTVSRRLAHVSPALALRQLGTSAPLVWLGLSRRRSRVPTVAVVATATAAIGAVAALLFAPSTGRDFRARLGNLGKSTGGALGGQLGKLFGRQVGGHPLQSAKIAGAVRDTFGSNEH
jgi:hypothetical protein